MTKASILFSLGVQRVEEETIIAALLENGYPPASFVSTCARQGVDDGRHRKT